MGVQFIKIQTAFLNSLRNFFYSLFHQYSLFWAIVSVVRTITVLIFFVIAEFNYAKYMNLAKKISKTTKTLNTTSIDPHFQGNFVFLRTNSIHYNNIYDPNFSISINAAILSRQVEYCQWIEQGFEASDKMTRTRRYRKDWVPQPLSSSMYMDKEYSNPEISPYSENVFFSNATVDKYILSSELFQDIIPFQPVLLNDSMKKTYQNSIASKSFTYIGGGYFYKSKDYNVTEKINTIKKTTSYFEPLIRFFDIFGIDIQRFNFSSLPKTNKYRTQSQILKALFLDCEAGDMRIKFTYWAPQSISAVGFVEGNTIRRHIVKGVPMGSARKGYLSKLKVLYKQHVIPRRIAYAARFLTIASLLLFVERRSPSSRARMWNFVFLGLSIFAVRSIIWKSLFLNPYMWCTLFLVFCYFYAIQPGDFIYF